MTAPRLQPADKKHDTQIMYGLHTSHAHKPYHSQLPAKTSYA